MNIRYFFQFISDSSALELSNTQILNFTEYSEYRKVELTASMNLCQILIQIKMCKSFFKII